MDKQSRTQYLFFALYTYCYQADLNTIIGQTSCRLFSFKTTVNIPLQAQVLRNRPDALSPYAPEQEAEEQLRAKATTTKPRRESLRVTEIVE